MSKLLSKNNSDSHNPSNLPIADPESGISKTMNYVANYNQSKNAKGNMCVTCVHYTKKEERKGKQYGTCIYFGSKALVPSDAWCAHWTKKT